MAGLLDTAVSGLRVSQTVLKTVGHNIANANTPGYSRQTVDIATNPAQLSGPGYIGSGAKITSVDRVVDEFLVEQLRADTSLASELNAFNENIKQLDTLLSDPSTGLSQGLDKFFAVLENAADDPTSIPSRQLVISEAENLSQRFNSLYDRIDTLNNNINQKLDVAVAQVSALAEVIAGINNSILNAQGGSDSVPNDLFDQREEALRKLSELIDIDIVEQGDGLLNVTIGSGQSLVVGTESRSLGLVDGVLDPQQKDIAYQDRTGNQNITSFLGGGDVGGLLDFRETILTEAYNELGRVAVVMSETFNEAHAQGIDMNDQFGGLFFTDVNDLAVAASRVFGDSDNLLPDDRVMSVEINDVSQLKASDYVLQASSGDTSFRITRASDNEVVYAGAFPGSLPAAVEFDGLQLNFLEGTFQPGDKFLIRPTRTGARDIGTEIERPDALALASPLATDISSGNTGNASITEGSVTSLRASDGSALPLFNAEGTMSPPLLVRFTSATTYEVLNNSDPANPIDLDPPMRNRPYVPGQTNALFDQDSGASIATAAGASLGIGTVTNGAIPLATSANGYPVEIYTVVYTDPATGNAIGQSLTTTANASAQTLAGQLSDLDGVTAYARNTVQLGGFDNLTRNVPLQVTLNGEDLLQYETGGALTGTVPDPAANPAGFNQYLAERINENENFQAAGIQAVAATNSITGRPELRVEALKGQDLNVSLTAQTGEALTVTDYNNSAVELDGAGVGNAATVTVGGTVDIEFSSDYRLLSNPTLSGILGDTSAANFAQSSYLGIDVSINGVPDEGDQFHLTFNSDGIFDNRNAISLVNLSSVGFIDSGLKTISDGYSTLVESVGIKTNASNINLEASNQVLQQTEDLRNSISGVNLDEEASKLIQFEQVYNANAQVISVARDLFDRLISIF